MTDLLQHFDTKGPEIRLGCFKDGKVSLEEGQIFTFTNKDIEGTNECVSITYKELYKDVQPGGHILVDDGLVDLGGSGHLRKGHCLQGY